MLRTLLRTTILLCSFLLVASGASATPVDEDGAHSTRHERTWGHGSGKSRIDHDWLRSAFEHLAVPVERKHDDSRVKRGLQRWLERHAEETSEKPGKRWGWRLRDRDGSDVDRQERNPRSWITRWQDRGRAGSSTGTPDLTSQQPVPEPAALVAFAAGLVVLARASRRRS